MSWIQPADLAQWLGPTSPSVINPVMAQFLCDQVTAAMQQWLGRNILAANYTEVLDGAGLDYIVPANWPTTAIASLVTVDCLTPLQPFAFDARVPGYVLPDPSQDGRVIKLVHTCAPLGRSTVQLIHTAGYATLPPPLFQALILWAQALDSAQALDPNLMSESSGDGAFSGSIRAGGAGSIPPAAEALAQKFRKKMV